MLESSYISVHRFERVPLALQVSPEDTTETREDMRIVSDNPGVADVVDGHIVGKGVGRAELTIQSQNCTAYCQVYVDAPITGVGLSKRKATIHRGDELRLSYSVYPSDTTDPYVTTSWVSRDPDIASVDRYGKVTAYELGETEIVLTCNTFTSVCRVTVDAPIQSVSLDLDKVTVHRGEIAVLKPVILPRDTTEEPDFT